jgi:MYXO-CTERM domain-containing protein
VVSVIRRVLILVAMVVLALDASLMVATQTGAGPTPSPQPVQMAQAGQGPSGPGLCFATQRCVPANHPGSVGAASPILMLGFIGAVAVVLVGLRRRRRGPVDRPTPSTFFPGVFRPPIAS